jgi:hypothetical protein
MDYFILANSASAAITPNDAQLASVASARQVFGFVASPVDQVPDRDAVADGGAGRPFASRTHHLGGGSFATVEKQ